MCPTGKIHTNHSPLFSRGQLLFDFLVSLNAIAILFIALLSLVYVQNSQSILSVERLARERTCEILSNKLVAAKVNGDGYTDTFYTRIPLSFNGTREVYFGEDYLCPLPEEYTTMLTTDTYDGEFFIKNENGKLIIGRPV